jgi:hypothetical protein
MSDGPAAEGEQQHRDNDESEEQAPSHWSN